jgi:hypothetical protein
MRLDSVTIATCGLIVIVSRHRKEWCRDTLLRQVGSLTGKWHFFCRMIVQILYEYLNAFGGMLDADT